MLAHIPRPSARSRAARPGIAADRALARRTRVRAVEARPRSLRRWRRLGGACGAGWRRRRCEHGERAAGHSASAGFRAATLVAQRLPSWAAADSIRAKRRQRRDDRIGVAAAGRPGRCRRPPAGPYSRRRKSSVRRPPTTATPGGRSSESDPEQFTAPVRAVLALHHRVFHADDGWPTRSGRMPPGHCPEAARPGGTGRA